MIKPNLRWSRRVLFSRNFLVVTDEEAALFLDINNPKKLTSIVTLQYQSATLKMFSNRLQSLMREHDKALEKLRKRETKRSQADTKSRKGA